MHAPEVAAQFLSCRHSSQSSWSELFLIEEILMQWNYKGRLAYCALYLLGLKLNMAHPVECILLLQSIIAPTVHKIQAIKNPTAPNDGTLLLFLFQDINR